MTATWDTARLAPATVTGISTGDIRPTRKPRRSPSRPLPVTESRIPRAALEAAARIAGGDRSRLVFNPDGTVLIQNAPRKATR